MQHLCFILFPFIVWSPPPPRLDPHSNTIFESELSSDKAKQGIYPMLVACDAGPALNQHCFNVSFAVYWALPPSFIDI